MLYVHTKYTVQQNIHRYVTLYLHSLYYARTLSFAILLWMERADYFVTMSKKMLNDKGGLKCPALMNLLW